LQLGKYLALVIMSSELGERRAASGERRRAALGSWGLELLVERVAPDIIYKI
jgi:hypothetical protein